MPAQKITGELGSVANIARYAANFILTPARDARSLRPRGSRIATALLITTPEELSRIGNFSVPAGRKKCFTSAQPKWFASSKPFALSDYRRRVVTDSARILARQLSTNAVLVFSARTFGRQLMTFQDATIAANVERLLLEVAAVELSADHVSEGTDLGSGNDSGRSKALAAVSAALQTVDGGQAVEPPKQPDPSPDSNAGQQTDIPQFMKGDPERLGVDAAVAEVDRLLGKAA